MTLPARKIPRLVEIRRCSWLNPAFVRVVVTGPGLADFPEPPAADSYVKVIVQHPLASFRRDLDLQQARAELPQELWPAVRAYTVRHWSAERRELTLDVLVHRDDHGPVGPGSAWAASAAPGQLLHLTGPGGSFRPDPGAAWQLLMGDLSALPAISVIAESEPPRQSWILLEIDHPEEAVEFPEGWPVRWLLRAGRTRGTALLAALDDLPIPPNPLGQAFIHGEAGWVRLARRRLLSSWRLPLDRLSASGYWKSGSPDEAWRAAKGDWLASLDQPD
ncbi:MAG: siderophore-interacting protein [Angustibacter sp.]